jgi:hypothetical protein
MTVLLLTSVEFPGFSGMTIDGNSRRRRDGERWDPRHRGK